MRRQLLVAIFPGLAGCAAIEGPRDHVVMFSAAGDAVDPSVGAFSTKATRRLENAGPDDLEPTGAWRDYLDSMFAAARQAGDDPARRRLVVFVHGGLNTPRGTIERANDLLPRMTEDGCYPIFVNWRSSLFSSYFEHLLFVRQGEDWGWWGAPLSPLFLTYDVTKAVILSPFIAAQEIWRFVGTNGGYDSKEQDDADNVGDVLAREWRNWKKGPQTDPPPTPTLRGRDDRSWFERARSVTAMTLTLPIKFVSGPFVVAMGSPAWDVMSRRVHLLLDSPPSARRAPRLSPDDPKKLVPAPPTQFLQFVARLARFQREEAAAGRTWEIDLIGHSMGTMVANGILLADGRTNAGEPSDVPDFGRVVYMAAACSLRDWEASVLPYMLRHGSTRFYQLTLQDKAEDAERNAFDLSPRGSLLAWIDDFLSQPLAPLDQTAGRFRNFMLDYEHVAAGLQRRIHVIEYGFGDDLEAHEPQKHGQFGDLAFWQRKFFDATIADHPRPR